MNVILDTCALLWLTLDPSELSGKAHDTIKDAGAITVCSASLWEIAIKTIKGKINIGMSVQEYAERCAKASDFEILAIDHNDWVASALLNWTHKDPIDRLLVAMAKRMNAKIITDDRIIKEYYAKCVS